MALFSLLLLLILLVAGSVVYSLLSLIAAMKYLSVPRGQSGTLNEPMSVLKPLAGLDEGLKENLLSFFVQDYPAFELLFAVRQESDACVPVVRRLMAENPQITSRLLITGEPPYPHAKVFSLSRMLEQAQHDLVVMSDSDIRVDSGFLKRAAAEFFDGTAALATCPYRAVAGQSFWSKLEACGMNTTFWQGVLTARMLDGMKFAVGPTIIARKKAIDAVGGMEDIRDFLAEDFELGRRVQASGAKVILSRQIVEHRIGSETAAQNFAHRIRWSRTSRRSRPAGYFGQLFTHPLPLAILAAMVAWLANAPWGIPVFVLAAAVRIAAGWVTARLVLGGNLNWLLLPIEDVLGFAFWIAGFFGSTIVWRGRKYSLNREGKAVIAPVIEKG